jgi:carboxyl-terminal processing protease
MRRRFHLLCAGALLAIVAAGLPTAWGDPTAAPPKALPAGRDASATPDPANDEAYKETLLFNRVIELIRQDYVDERKVGYKDLVTAALKGMLSSLDPHSQFLDEDAFTEMQRDTKGEFTGLGIVVGLNKDSALTVISALEGTPGYRAGILPGDRILKINDAATEKMTYSTAVKALRGKRGEKIRLTLYRPATKDAPKSPTVGAITPGAPSDNPGEIFELELAREIIHVDTVREVKLLPPEVAGDDKVGYLRLEQFGENTVAEFDKALDVLQKQGVHALVIDLRNDPGGLLDAAVDVAGTFLPPGTVVVSTQGRDADTRRDYRSHRTQAPVAYPIAVLVNGYSASGSEIVAGALQDLKRAVIVGQTTFGKGSVQSVINLGDGVGLRLTTAKYYTPSGRVIHEKGVDPDILAPIPASEERDMIRLRSPALLSPEERTRLKDFHDTQLERAVAVLRGILLRGERAPVVAAVPTSPTA